MTAGITRRGPWTGGMALVLALSLTTFSMTVAGPARAASAQAGKTAFERLGCGACHAVTRPAPGMTLAQRVARKGPDLWFAGSKFRPEWLATWLPKPKSLLEIRYDRLAPEGPSEPHPAAPAADVPDLVAYLMSLKDPEMKTGVVDGETPLSPMVALDGRILFGKDQQCYACHKTETRYGAVVGGKTAPSLVDVGKRLNPDWIYAYLTDPTRYVPVTRMPIYSGETFPGYDAKQRMDLARYLAWMGRK
jgi:cytochrome c2